MMDGILVKDMMPGDCILLPISGGWVLISRRGRMRLKAARPVRKSMK